MARKPRRKQGGIVDANDGTAPRFSRVVVVIVALENYRKPSNGDALPSVAFAHADADGIREAVLEIFKHLPAGDVEIEVMKDTDASLIAVKDHLAYKIRSQSTTMRCSFFIMRATASTARAAID
ncbi:hypothetical protein ACVWXO_000274 [Bradyrhizobium sp. LM2.7]